MKVKSEVHFWESRKRGVSRFRAILALWRLSLFEKVILANSVIVVGEALVGLWVTSHNLEAHHYLIDTSFIVLSTLLALLTNVVLLRASFRPLFRQGLKLLLGRQADMQVVGEARTGREAIALAQELAPDVVVMDITMPDMDGLIATRHIRAHRSATQVLMLTMHESEEYFLQALRVGAVGYLVKKAAPTDLQMAIRAVAHGDAFLCTLFP